MWTRAPSRRTLWAPAVQEWVPKLAAVCKVNGFEIYGDPGPKVAEMAAGFGAVVFQYWLGIDR